MTPDAPAPLADLRVVDVSTVLAGPSCARYLADFGADVIKVERPGAGDGVRSMGWRDPRDHVTLWWKLAARNKRCIALDLKDPDDVDVFLRLCDRAHVVIENFHHNVTSSRGSRQPIDRTLSPDPGRSTLMTSAPKSER